MNSPAVIAALVIVIFFGVTFARRNASDSSDWRQIILTGEIVDLASAFWSLIRIFEQAWRWHLLSFLKSCRFSSKLCSPSAQFE